MKISFEYNDVMTLRKYQDIARGFIARGWEVFIISERASKVNMMTIADRLGIDKDNVYATGSNINKIEKIVSLKINRHYDSNPNVTEALRHRGEIVRFSFDERSKYGKET